MTQSIDSYTPNDDNMGDLFYWLDAHVPSYENLVEIGDKVENNTLQILVKRKKDGDRDKWSVLAPRIVEPLNWKRVIAEIKRLDLVEAFAADIINNPEDELYGD